jgi:vanillate O-demethylase monooxygenase subunit
VYPTSIGQHEIVVAPIKATTTEDSVTATRWMYDIDPPPFWAANLKSHEKCELWQVCQFSLRANVLIDVGVALARTDAPERNRSKRVTGIVVNLMTQGTETTTWYHGGCPAIFRWTIKA